MRRRVTVVAVVAFVIGAVVIFKVDSMQTVSSDAEQIYLSDQVSQLFRLTAPSAPSQSPLTTPSAPPSPTPVASTSPSPTPTSEPEPSNVPLLLSSSFVLHAPGFAVKVSVGPLRECVEARLTIEPVLDPSMSLDAVGAALRSLVNTMDVDLVSVTQFTPIARDDPQYDSIWYRGSTSPTTPSSQCSLGSLSRDTESWIRTEHVPEHPFKQTAGTAEEAGREIAARVRLVFSPLDPDTAPHQPHRLPHPPRDNPELWNVPFDCSVLVRRLPKVLVSRTVDDGSVEASSDSAAGPAPNILPTNAKCIPGYECGADINQWVCLERCGCAFNLDKKECFESGQANPTEPPPPSPSVASLAVPFAPDRSSAGYAIRIRLAISEGNCLTADSPGHATLASCAGTTGNVSRMIYLPMQVVEPVDGPSCAVPARVLGGSVVRSGLHRIAHHGYIVPQAGGEMCHPLLHVETVPQPSHFGMFARESRDRVEPLLGDSDRHVIAVTAGQLHRLVIRPLADVADSLAHSVRHVTFRARLTSEDRIVNVDIASEYDDDAEGYIVTLDVREAGDYILEVYMHWVYGDAEEYVGPLPVLTSSHMAHQFHLCHLRRSQIFGGPFIVRVAESPSPVQVWGENRCVSGNELGRWVWLDSEHCENLRCTGDEGLRVSIANWGWSGDKSNWVWVPYRCHYHLFGKEDLDKCVREMDQKWWIVNGDSQVREALGHLHLITGFTDIFGKFAALERNPLIADLRLTYQFNEGAFKGNISEDSTGNRHPFSRGWWPYFEHFNVMPSCTSGLPVAAYRPNKLLDSKVGKFPPEFLDEVTVNHEESRRPDAFVFNLGMAYVAENMPLSEVQKVLADVESYFTGYRGSRNDRANRQTPEFKLVEGSVDEASARDSCPTDEEIENKYTPMKVVWYSAPAISSQAHARSEQLTDSRIRRYNELFEKRLSKIGIPILDSYRITQSRMEEGYDGLHYMRSTVEDPGHGVVSAMIQQVLLNILLDKCPTAPPPLGPEEIQKFDDASVVLEKAPSDVVNENVPEVSGSTGETVPPEGAVAVVDTTQNAVDAGTETATIATSPTETIPDGSNETEGSQTATSNEPVEVSDNTPIEGSATTSTDETAKPADNPETVVSTEINLEQSRSEETPVTETVTADEITEGSLLDSSGSVPVSEPIPVPVVPAPPVQYVRLKGTARLGTVSADFTVSKMHNCVPSAVKLTPTGALSIEALQKLRASVSVELISFSNFGFPAISQGAGDDTVWYAREVDPGKSFLYHCNLGTGTGAGTGTGDGMTWVSDENIPESFRQPEGLSSTSAAVSTLQRAKVLFDKSGAANPEQPHREKKSPESVTGVTFSDIPPECSVHVRTLPLVIVDNQFLEAPFTTDRSSKGYAIRIRVTGACDPLTGCSRTLVLPVVPAEEEFQMCRLPAWIPRANIHKHDVQSDDQCYPLLHVEVAPLAVHFGVFRDGTDNEVVSSPLHGNTPADVIQGTAGDLVRLVIRALPETRDSHGHAIRHASFIGRMTSPNRIINVNVKPEFDESVGGYVVEIDVREAGQYALELYLSWIYGDEDDHQGLEPILVGPHMGHRWRCLNNRRAVLFGGPWVVDITAGQQQLSVFGDKPCTTADEPGRWVDMDTSQCVVPYCVGQAGFEASVGGYGWGGEKTNWIFVPYTCYYRLFDKAALEKCSAEEKVDFVMIQGDSQIREMLGHFNLLGGYGDVYGKFAALERNPLIPGLRVSYFFQQYAYNVFHADKRGITVPFSRGFAPYLEHFNIRVSCEGGLPVSKYLPNAESDDPGIFPEKYVVESLGDKELERPDVLIFNAGMAYAAEKMTWREFKQWVDDAVTYFSEGHVLDAPETLPTSGVGATELPKNLRDVIPSLETSGSCEIPASVRTKLRVAWYTPLFVFAQAHPDSEWLSTHRARKYHEYALQAMRSIGVAVIDGWGMTAGRMEETYDGLHFMRSTIQDPGHGLASAMIQQAALNFIFPTCAIA